MTVMHTFICKKPPAKTLSELWCDVVDPSITKGLVEDKVQVNRGI